METTVSARLLAHAETWRPYTVSYVALVGLAGAALAARDGAGGGDDVPLWRYAVAAGVPVLAWVGALYGGDYFDRDLDRIAKGARPIPSGRLLPRTAWRALWVCVTVGALVAALTNPRTLLLSAVALAAGLAYSARLKQRGLLGNLSRGLMTATVVLFGGMCVEAWPTPVLLLPALVVLAHDVATNLVGTVRDVDGDRAGSCATVAVTSGVGTALRLAVTSYAIAVLAALATLGAADGRWAVSASTAAPALLALSVLTGSSAFALLARSTDRASALLAHDVLLVGRVLLASALVALGLGDAVGLSAAAGSVAVTVLATVGLRRRHERSAPAQAVPAQPDGPGAPTRDDVLSYVDAALARVASLELPLRTLSSWRRRIVVRLTDPQLEVHLLVGDGRLRRVGAHERDARPEVVVTTTGPVFAEVFLTRTTTPRRALLAGRLRFAGGAADMVHANALFAEFLRGPGAAGGSTARTGPVPGGRAATTAERVAPPGADEQESVPQQVVLADTTLRDGEQMPGVAFSVHQKVQIALLLDELGVGVVEAGYPAVSAAERAAVAEVAHLGLRAVTQAIARPVARDVDAALATGVDAVALFVGTSDGHVLGKLRTTRQALLEQVAAGVARAKAGGVSVVFAAEDAVRTDLDFLLDVFEAAVAAGADAVGVADTAGVARPATVASVVRRVSQRLEVPVAVHCHDDLGLAVANSLAGLSAGASGAQGSVLGIGERGGNAALEELALALEVAHGVPTGLRLPLLPVLAEVVADAAGLTISPTKPVVGAHAFTHESGLHVDGLLRTPGTYEPYDPARLGLSRRIVLGKHSGRSCVQSVLVEQGLPAAADDRELVGRLLDHVKHSAERGRPVDPAELAALAGAATHLPRQDTSKELFR